MIMKRILILIIGLISVAYGQSSPTSAKTRFVNGLYLGTKLDSYFNAADSNAIYWRADSSLMAKYKGAARALAFAVSGGYLPISDTAAMLSSRILGSGTASQIPYFSATNRVTSSPNLFWDNSLSRLKSKSIFIDSAETLVNEDDALYIETSRFKKNIGRGIKTVLNWGDGSEAYGSTAIEGQSKVYGDNAKDHSNVFQSFSYKEGTGRMQYMSNYYAAKILSNSNIGRYYGYYYNSGTGAPDSAWSFFSVGSDPAYISSKLAIADSTLPNSSIPYPLFVSKPFSNSEFGLTAAHLGLFSNNFYGIGVGGVLALGGRTGLSSDPYPFAFVRGAKSDLTTYGGFLSLHTTSDGTNAGEVNGGNYERLRINQKGQVTVGDSISLGSDVKFSVIGGRSYFENIISDVPLGGYTLFRKANNNVMVQGVKSGIIGSGNGAITYVYGQNPYDVYINNQKSWSIDSLRDEYLYKTPNASTTGNYDILTRNNTTGRTELISADSMVKPSAIGTQIQPYDGNTTIQGNSVTGTGSLVKAVSPTLSGSVLVTSSNAATNLTIDNTGSNFGSNLTLKKDGVINGFFGTVGALLGNSDLSLAAYATSGNKFKVYTNGNNLRLTVDTNITATEAFVGKKIIGSSATPSISGGSATYIGTGASTSVSGNDMAGEITLVTGTGCGSTGASNRSALSVTFSSAYATAPIVQIQAIQQGGLSSTDGPTNQTFFLRRDAVGTNGFTVYLPVGTTLTDSTTYLITYQVIGR